MFTGIIEELGHIKSVQFKGSAAKLAIECSKVLEGIKLGDSIAVNGVCLTAVDFSGNGFTVDASSETLSRSSLKQATAGTVVNLERAMLMGGRLGGHIVQGHVDGSSQITKIESDGAFWTLTIVAPEAIQKYIAEKGSVCIDGISLTVAKDMGSAFTIAVIPHTYANTNLSSLKIGSLVNIEVDVIARYTEKLLKADGKESRLAELLADW
ncbi:MAG: riboflavin synthase [Deferribacteraceae bacterium]|jgi:riboflavin synthase|nr:riboflavin synthase [Deferribacteraceae bacterium]